MCWAGVGGAVGWGCHCEGVELLRCWVDEDGLKQTLETLAAQRQRSSEQYVKLMEGYVLEIRDCTYPATARRGQNVY